MKKKVLLSIFIVACIGLFLGAGVYSLFQDVETTTGNTFAAGTLDLQVGATNPTTERINIPALKPGDTVRLLQAGRCRTWVLFRVT